MFRQIRTLNLCKHQHFQALSTCSILEAMTERPPKRQKTVPSLPKSSSLNRAISPPVLRRDKGSNSQASPSSSQTAKATEATISAARKTLIIESPFTLTKIRDLPDTKNVDTVTLPDLIGCPLIYELWSFNYMHNIKYVVQCMDEDTREECNIKIVHGHWKNDDPSKMMLEHEQKDLKNHSIELIAAYMPEMFGTHHTKMLVLFRHDNTLQIIVHTSNMIPFDWRNMTQGVWKSPRLPLLEDDTSERKSGVGYVFKKSFLAYVDAYGKKRCGKLADQVRRYDFADVRAVFIGHVPGRIKVDAEEQKLFGWLKLQSALSHVAVGGGNKLTKSGVVSEKAQPKSGEIVAQVSSIATLGATDAFLTKTFFPVCHSSSTGKHSPGKTHIIWPTVENVRTSCEGWDSGSAIHLKGEKPNAAKQLAWIQPYFAVWDARNTSTQTSSSSFSSSSAAILPYVDSGRAKAAPHIKTFIRFSQTSDKLIADYDRKHPPIDWMLLTSANLSHQAWGAAISNNEVRCCSYEAGVLIYPGLWLDLLDEQGTIEMRGVGGGQWVDNHDGEELVDRAESHLAVTQANTYQTVIVGVRLPYDYPLRPYQRGDMPWIAERDYGTLQDWKGETWVGH